jgi:hypothetical protein
MSAETTRNGQPNTRYCAEPDGAERYRWRGIATWLLGQAGWLALAGDRLRDYAYLDRTDARAATTPLPGMAVSRPVKRANPH